ncbi:MAG TPA: hypothetical protein VGV89_05875 [Thermoplasmata archaeon]|nr:hypothetical protein [Thermoplasmata archaeon]
MSAVESVEPPLTREQAVHELLRVERWSKPLLQRTVGLTWMIWAAVNGGIFVSYDAIAIANPSNPGASLAFGLAWMPWVLVGIGATWVLWRSFALILPSNSGGAVRTTVAATATFLALVLGGLAIVAFARVPIDGSAFAMIVIGLAAAAVGGSGLTTDSRSERSFWLLGGVGLALLTVGIELVAGRVGVDADTTLLVLGPIASTALLFGGGLYTATA